jgi:hypothetical protein
MSFSPRVNNKSSLLMKKRSTPIATLFRSCSPSSYRMSELSREERQEHAIKAHRHRVRSVSPANQRRQARASVTLRGSTIAKSYLSTTGGKLYPESVVESILAEGKVSDVLYSSRNKSRQNASVINQERKGVPVPCDHDYEVSSDGGKIFEPRMMSKESKRINARNETPFEDRMLKSMDEHRIKVKVNKAAGRDTPGPGQYSNTEECNRCCPLPRSCTPQKQAMRAKSPGASAYSFGRARRELL